MQQRGKTALKELPEKLISSIFLATVVLASVILLITWTNDVVRNYQRVIRECWGICRATYCNTLIGPTLGQKELTTWSGEYIHIYIYIYIFYFFKASCNALISSSFSWAIFFNWAFSLRKYATAAASYKIF